MGTTSVRPEPVEGPSYTYGASPRFTLRLSKVVNGVGAARPTLAHDGIARRPNASFLRRQESRGEVPGRPFALREIEGWTGAAAPAGRAESPATVPRHSCGGRNPEVRCPGRPFALREIEG